MGAHAFWHNGTGASNGTYCAPIHVDVSATGEALGIALAAATLFVPLPQIIKLYQTKSSYGVEPVTLCFVQMYAVLNTGAMVAVKWKQLGNIMTTVGAAGLKMELDLLQALFSMIDWTWILITTVCFPPHNTARYRGMVVGTYSLLLGAVGTIFFLSAREPCGPAPLALAKVFGYISGGCTMVAFLPQLHTTWRCKSAGSLSLIFTAIQVCGCYLIAVNQMFVSQDPWVIWAPTATSGTMQLLILALASYYHFCGKAAAQGVSGTGAEGLLDGDAAAAERALQHDDEHGPHSPYVPYEVAPVEPRDAAALPSPARIN